MCHRDKGKKIEDQFINANLLKVQFMAWVNTLPPFFASSIVLMSAPEKVSAPVQFCVIRG